MSILTGVREIIYNFTHQIKDNNTLTTDVSSQELAKIALECGITDQNVINELISKKDGIGEVENEQENTELRKRIVLKGGHSNIPKVEQVSKQVEKNDKEIEL